MEIKALRKETATRSHLTHRRITDSSRAMLESPWPQALRCPSPQPQPLAAAVTDLWLFSPLVSTSSPSDASSCPLRRCRSEEQPWAWCAAPGHGSLPSPRARGALGSGGWDLQRWAVGRSVRPGQASLKTHPALHPCFLGRRSAATLRVGGMAQPGTEAQKPGQRSHVCPRLCLHNPLPSARLWYLNPDEDGAAGRRGLPLAFPSISRSLPPLCFHVPTAGCSPGMS